MTSSLPQYWEHFNFNHAEVEKNVSSQNGSYQGLDPRALYTAREDYLKIFESSHVKGTFVDLGCGTGEGALLYSSLFPNRLALGIDFTESRLKIGKNFQEKFKLRNCQLIQGDLLKTDVPQGDCYFLYFPTGMVLDKILSELYSSSTDFTLIAIESHGDLLGRLGLENWLDLIETIELTTPRHHPQAHIYRRNFNSRDPSLLPFGLSFKDFYLLIQEESQVWIGDSLGMEWYRGDQFTLSNPPRTISWGQVKNVFSLTQIPPLQRFALELRKQGELRIKTSSKIFLGKIRKIIISPVFTLELSTGEQVEWEDILTIHQGYKLCYESP